MFKREDKPADDLVFGIRAVIEYRNILDDRKLHGCIASVRATAALAKVKIFTCKCMFMKRPWMSGVNRKSDIPRQARCFRR